MIVVQLYIIMIVQQGRPLQVHIVLSKVIPYSSSYSTVALQVAVNLLKYQEICIKNIFIDVWTIFCVSTPTVFLAPQAARFEKRSWTGLDLIQFSCTIF